MEQVTILSFKLVLLLMRKRTRISSLHQCREASHRVVKKFDDIGKKDLKVPWIVLSLYGGNKTYLILLLVLSVETEKLRPIISLYILSIPDAFTLKENMIEFLF